MSSKFFDEFVNQQAEWTSQQEIDWSKQLEEWMGYLDAFYSRVKCFLQKYVTEGKVQIDSGKRQLHEGSIGAYDAQFLVVTIGSSKIHFEPIGTNLIGAKGRVDMNGPRGTVRFVLVPQGSSGPKINIRVRDLSEELPTQEAKPSITEWAWKIATPPPNIKYIELEEESFYSAMMEVVNG